MVKSQFCEASEGLKKGPWTAQEDQKLLAYIQQHGHGSWRALPSKAGLQRCGKSCRLRWKNYLKPDIKRGKFSLEEERTIIQLHALLGNRWSAIATQLPKRTDNEIKNYWNTHLKKKLTMMGFDPATHKRQWTTLGSSATAANLSHMAQWESTRLEAERRLVKESESIRQLVLDREREEYSLDQIVKKMPTIFAPPRWQSRLLWKSEQGSWHPQQVGSFIPTDHSKSETSSESTMILAAEGLGCQDVIPEEANNNPNLIESSFEENEVSTSYWNEIPYLLNCGPSNFSVN